ncbi:MAG: sigma 54-interacting transcriptional regulator [Polyangiaceae bacterium]
MARQHLLRAAEVAIQNPFRDGDWATACQRLLAEGVAAPLGDAVRRGDTTLAKRLVLALGVAQAAAGVEPKKLLDDHALPARLAKELPRPRGAYVRVAAAAGRATRALGALRGRSAAMQRVRRDTWAACFGESLYHALVLEAVVRDHDVLILGETGTGKETVAEAIVTGTPGDATGSPCPRAALNAAAVPDTLIESELFGHVRGAFTGAQGSRAGRIRSAADGCFFLDEIGDLTDTAQAKLLRVMETDEVTPLGSDKAERADVRYVAATHQDLAAMVDAGSFRRDLYQRLAGNVIELPPLRERPEDIVDIGLAFVTRYVGAEADTLGLGGLRQWLESAQVRGYPWPGNVRELQNALRNTMLGLPTALRSDASPSMSTPLPPALVEGSWPLSQVESWYIERAVARSDGNLSEAARVLGVDRSTLARRLRRKSAS